MLLTVNLLVLTLIFATLIRGVRIAAESLKE